MAKAKKKQVTQGQIRQSQIVSTFGPGSMVDLPDHSVMIGGLDHWHGDRKPIYEDRLATKVCLALDIDDISMYAPPVDSPDMGAPATGITAFTFPSWFVAQWEEDYQGYRSRPLVHYRSLQKSKWMTPEREKRPVVPVRFVQACPNGHISDINWHAFVHEDFRDPCRGQLWLDEGGTSGDLADIHVRCEACKKRRQLSHAKLPKAGVLGKCGGRRPWLGRGAHEPCVDEKTGKEHFNRLLIRSASNAWFGQKLSVIHIPDTDQQLREAVDRVFEDFLQYVEGAGDIAHERKKKKVFEAIKDFSDAEVWKEVSRRKDPSKKPSAKKIKEAEIETLLSSPTSIGNDRPEGDFFAVTRKLGKLPPVLDGMIDRVVLVHRLREVTALIGFTRFEAGGTDIHGELDIGVRRAALSLDPVWVPAAENRGEGVFISFKREAIGAWLQQPGVVARGKELTAGFDAWAGARESKAEFPGLPYIMLHSLSHLLITAVALECGYAASSIRERIYASDKGFGILLHTGTPGSEGTLGGIIQVGKRIEQYLLSALEMGKLCSNDPVCAEHGPANPYEERFLHGAACHGCVLISETSCERRNELLDRALVVPTVSTPAAAFFVDPAVRPDPVESFTLEAPRGQTSIPTIAPDAEPEGPDYDPDLFDESWLPLLDAWSEAGLQIEPGGEAAAGGRVLGAYEASVSNGAADVYLVADAPGASGVVEALRGDGHRALVVRPDDPEVMATVLAALGKDA